MRKQFICAAMLLALHGGFAHAQPPPPHPDPEPIGQKLIADDGAANDQFGVNVAVDGDTAVIGANWSDTANGVDSGSAYVFVRENSTWIQKQKLIPNDGNYEYLFGGRAAISGDTILIGSAWDDAKGEKSGSAYVFVRAADGSWTQQAKLLPSDGAGWDTFGDPVALDGDIAVVGAWGDDDKGDASGSAYVFVRSSDDTWTQKQKLLPNDGASGDHFGYPISLHDDGIMLIGAGRDDGDKGAAYVFVQDADGTWTQQAKLVASDGATGDVFGHSIAISGNIALIGAIFDDDNGADSGSVYVFERETDGTWSEKQKITADDGAAGDKFCVVALNGNSALIGVPGKNSSTGASYIFARAADGAWSQQEKLTADDGDTDDQFGVSVSLTGSTALIGARGLLGSGKQGYAYIYDLSSSADAAITSCQELQNIKNNLSGNYYLANDIDCAGFDFGDGSGFMPLGNADTPFTGTFDGKGHTISNVFINRPSDDLVGIFGFAGSYDDSAEADISHVIVTGFDITGRKVVGGLFGQISYSTTTDVHSDGVVNGESYVGGLGGDNRYSTITNASSSGSVNGDHNGTDTDKIAYGGLVGLQYLDSVHGDGSSPVIKNSYSTGTATGGNNTNGILGLLYNTGTCADNYWDVTTSGVSTDGCGSAGRATAAMQTQSTFVGWDFDAVWTMNGYYPELQCVPSPGEHTVTPSAETGGSISPDTPQEVNHGTTASFTVLADSGYRVENVEGCGGTLSGSTYTTAPVTEDCEVTASFTPHADRD